MNPLELRSATRNFLLSNYAPEEVEAVELLSPHPGEPVAMKVVTSNFMDEVRTYTITIKED